MKVWNYMAMMLTMMVFLTFLGFSPAGSGDVFDDIGLNISSSGEVVEADVANSSWYAALFNPIDGYLVAAGLLGAIFVGFFTKSFDWKLALSGFFVAFVVKFIMFGKAIVTLAQTGDTWLVGIVATIFVPLTVMFVFSVVEWFGGND